MKHRACVRWVVAWRRVGTYRSRNEFLEARDAARVQYGRMAGSWLDLGTEDVHGCMAHGPCRRGFARYDKALDTFLSTAPGGDTARDERRDTPRPAHRPSGTRHPTAPHGTRHARPRRDETGLHVHVSPLSPHPLRSPRSKTRERRLPCRRDERHTRRKTTRVGPEGSRDRIRLIVARRSAIKRRHLPGSHFDP